MGSYLGTPTCWFLLVQGPLLVLLGGARLEPGASKPLPKTMWYTVVREPCPLTSYRIVVAGALLQGAVVPSSAAPFDFQAAYGLSNQLVCVLPSCSLSQLQAKQELTSAIPDIATVSHSRCGWRRFRPGAAVDLLTLSDPVSSHLFPASVG